jgi:hypothetical protein
LVEFAERIEDLLPGIIVDLFVCRLWQAEIRLVIAFPQTEYSASKFDGRIFD